MKKAFTLIELLIVVAIIGVLSAIMLGVFSGGNEAARNARCLSNMRNLASACQSYAANYGWYPIAGSVEQMDFVKDSGSGARNFKKIYSEHPGWISWNSAGAYDNAPTRSCASSGWQISTYDQNEDARMYSLTNGVLWKFVSGNHETYLCPAHVNKMKKQPPNWSYVMNAYFGWTSRPGSEHHNAPYKIEFGTLKRADKILLFAEIPFAGIGVTANDTTSSGQACDCTLQYRGLSNVSSPETIGFNHKVGKREYCANVVFADGHIEQLIYPRSGMSESELQELTEWLCKGIDVGLNGDKYEKLIDDGK